MIVIPPIDCTAPGALTATNAVDAAAWSAGTAYAADAVISYAKRNWISVQAANIGKTPDSEPLWWADAGPINSLAMFDTSVSTATARTGHLVFTLAPGRRYSAIGFMGLIGNSIKVEIVEAGNVIFSETRTLAATDGSYYSFCFEGLQQTGEATFIGLPGPSTSLVTVTIYGASPTTGTTACGLCVIGKQFDAGVAQMGAGARFANRGRNYLDAKKNPVNLERGFSKSLFGTLVTPTVNANRLNAWLGTNIGVACLWVAAPGIKDLSSFVSFGIYEQVTVVIADVVNVTTAFEIAGNY